jgi:hypothetical protein
MGVNSAATGGMVAPAAEPSPMEQAIPATPQIGADEVPNLTDPTARPAEPVTAGLSVGPGPGPEAVGPMPPSPSDPVRQAVQALMLIAPNPDLTRIMNRLDYEGR